VNAVSTATQNAMAMHKIYIASILMASQLVVPFDKPSMADEIAGPEKQQGPMDCGWAGVQVSPMIGPVADILGRARSYGAIFNQPEPGGPAAKAGIEAGDVLTAMNGVPLEKSSDFAEIAAR
jgi:serine protease Do